MIKRFLTPRWILTTLIVIVGVGVLIRLGFWQLDRLEWRRAFNSRAAGQLNAPVLDLNTEQPIDQLFDMEYRTASVRGTYDFTQEALLRNQVWDSRLGFHVLTPLQIDGTDWFVLVDRGWIPFEDGAQSKRVRYQESGTIALTGMIRRSQEKPDFGGVPDPTLAPGEVRLDAWNVVNVQRIQEQSGLKLLPVYIIQAPESAWTALPYRSLPKIEISEGSHQSYAIQWFSFAAILGIGYPFFLRRQLSRKETDRGATDDVSGDIREGVTNG